ncbi:hypothetical protein ACTFIR_006351 [Dictyostelium discoideum]
MIIITKPILTTILKQGFKFSNSQSNQIIRSYSKGLLLGQNGFDFNNNNRNKQIISFSSLNNCKNIKGLSFFRITRQFSSSNTPTKNNNNQNNNQNNENNNNENKNENEGEGEKDENKLEEVEISSEEASSLRNKRKDKLAGMFNKSKEPVKKEEETSAASSASEQEEGKQEEKESSNTEENQVKEEQAKSNDVIIEPQVVTDGKGEKVVIEGDLSTFYIYTIFSALFVGTIGIAIAKLISDWRNSATGVLGIQQFDFVLLIQDIYFGDLKPAMEVGNKEFNEKTKKNYFFDEANIKHATLGDTITLIIPILQKKTNARLGHINVDFCKEGNEMTIQNFYINAINGYVYDLPAPKHKIDTTKERYSGKYSLEELLADPTL